MGGGGVQSWQLSRRWCCAVLQIRCWSGHTEPLISTQGSCAQHTPAKTIKQGTHPELRRDARNTHRLAVLVLPHDEAAVQRLAHVDDQLATPAAWSMCLKSGARNQGAPGHAGLLPRPHRCMPRPTPLLTHAPMIHPCILLISSPPVGGVKASEDLLSWLVAFERSHGLQDVLDVPKLAHVGIWEVVRQSRPHDLHHADADFSWLRPLPDLALFAPFHVLGGLVRGYDLDEALLLVLRTGTAGTRQVSYWVTVGAVGGWLL